MEGYLKTWGERINHPQKYIAEKTAEEYYKSKQFDVFRFGFDLLDEDVDVNSWCKIPILIRKKPDYIIVKSSASFIEVKGFINVVRLKEEDIKAYKFWQEQFNMKMWFFFYSKANGMAQVPYYKVLEIIKKCEKEVMPDNGKTYYKIYIKQLEEFIINGK